MPVMFPWYASCALLVKTSLLGFGLLTIGLALVALLALRLFASALPSTTRQRLKQLFKTALYLQLAAYGAVALKLVYALWSDASWHDIPSFLLSHYVMHHALSALSATLLILLTIRLYNHRHANRPLDGC